MELLWIYYWHCVSCFHLQDSSGAKIPQTVSSTVVVVVIVLMENNGDGKIRIHLDVI